MPILENYRPENMNPSMRKYLDVPERAEAQDAGTAEGAKKGWEKRRLRVGDAVLYRECSGGLNGVGRVKSITPGGYLISRNFYSDKEYPEHLVDPHPDKVFNDGDDVYWCSSGNGVSAMQPDRRGTVVGRTDDGLLKVRHQDGTISEISSVKAMNSKTAKAIGSVV